MRTKLQLELLRKLRQRKGQAKGFTLIELMIVVAIIGVLAAVGIPKYVAVRNNAQASAMVGDVLGKAKECATYVVAGGVGTAPTDCTTSAGGSFAKTWTGTNVSGIPCLNDTAAAGDLTVTVTVATDGGMSCSFS